MSDIIANLQVAEQVEVVGTPTNGQVPVYNATAGKWEPGDVTDPNAPKIYVGKFTGETNIAGYITLDTIQEVFSSGLYEGQAIITSGKLGIEDYNLNATNCFVSVESYSTTTSVSSTGNVSQVYHYFQGGSIQFVGLWATGAAASNTALTFKVKIEIYGGAV